MPQGPKPPVQRTRDRIMSYRTPPSTSNYDIQYHQPPDSSPRVVLEYGGEIGEQIVNIQLPFVMGVLADLSGTAHLPRPDVVQRPLVEFDAGRFDLRMRELGPRVVFQVENILTFDAPLEVDLTLECMTDFSPDAVARKIAPLHSLLEDRTTLAQQMSDMVSWSQVMDRLTHPVAIQALKNLSSTTAVMNAIDERVNAQINLILHHPEFQTLESAWRGLHYLVSNSPTGELLKIRVMDISKKELHRTLRHFKGNQQQGPIFKRLHEELEHADGEPLGCLIGDYEFDHSPADTELLTELAAIATEAHCPFISSAAPSLLQLKSWKGLAGLGEPAAIFSHEEYKQWQVLCRSENAHHLCLTLPRFLARPPYGGPQSNSTVNAFKFSEHTACYPHDQNKFTWARSAYVMAVAINRAFSQYGWFATIGHLHGTLVDNLPTHDFASSGRHTVSRAAEVALHEKQAFELAQLGFSPLLGGAYADQAFFSEAPSFHQPDRYENLDTHRRVKLSATLSDRLTACRFVHYLRCIARSRIGAFIRPVEMERHLNRWISAYIVEEGHSVAPSAARPLLAARVEVKEVAEAPGAYALQLFLRLGYQFDSPTDVMRLISKLTIGHQGLR